LLIEESRTNLVTYSENYDNSTTPWTDLGTGATLTANATISPDGTQNATLMFNSGSNAQEDYYFSFSNLQSYTISMFVKKTPNTTNAGWGFRTAGGGTSRISGNFNLDNVTATAGNQATNATITDYGNGWYRCSVSGPVSSNENRFSFGEGRGLNQEMYVWGVQLELGAFPTSYIPTSGSTVTRQPDTAYITGTNFTDFYNATEWTMFSYAKSIDPNKFGFAWILHAGNNGKRYGLSPQNPPAGDFFERTQNYGGGGTGDITHPTGTDYNSGFVKAACCIGSSANAYTNGLEGTVADAFENYPLPATELAIGFRGSYSADSYVNGHIKQLIYYPTRLTNTQLQALTQ